MSISRYSRTLETVNENGDQLYHILPILGAVLLFCTVRRAAMMGCTYAACALTISLLYCRSEMLHPSIYMRFANHTPEAFSLIVRVISKGTHGH